MVGAATDAGNPLGRGRGAGSRRHAGSANDSRGGGEERNPRRAIGGPRAARQRRAAAAADGGGMTTPRLQLADELLRRFSAALRSTQLYSKGHPIIARNLDALSTAVTLL